MFQGLVISVGIIQFLSLCDGGASCRLLHVSGLGDKCRYNTVRTPLVKLPCLPFTSAEMWDKRR